MESREVCKYGALLSPDCYAKDGCFCLLPFAFCLLPSPTFAQRATSKRAPAVESQNDLSSATRQSLEQAIAFLQQNNLTEAEKAARSAVASSPRSPVTHNLLGVVLNQANRQSE